MVKNKKKFQQKVSRVMEEWGEGKLRTGPKKKRVVKSQKQALAIAYSEARKRGLKVPKRKK